MKSFWLSILMLGISAVSLSQQAHDSGMILEESVSLREQGKTKEAVRLLATISKNDTNYTHALYQRALLLLNDSSYQEAKEVAELGLFHFPERRNEWFNLIANATDELGQPAAAIRLYDAMLATNPNDHIAWFNKGVVYSKMNEHDQSIRCLQQCLLINPFYTSAHFLLAGKAKQQGRIPEALMAYMANLLIHPGNKFLSANIGALSEISKMEDNILALADKRTTAGADDFNDIQDILVNKLALDKKYKLKASLEDPIVRQMQVLLEKVSYNAADTGFWMQYYVPFYEAVYKQGLFEPFVFHLFSQLDLKEVKTYVKRNSKEINALTDLASGYFQLIKATRQKMVAARDTVTRRYHYSDGSLDGIGQVVEKGEESLLVGPWKFYYENGNIRSEGNFSKEGKKTGPWVFYHENGTVKERSTFIEGNTEGKIVTWFANGVLASEFNYKNGERNGASAEYYYSGQLKKKESYKGGKKHGPTEGYTAEGFLSYVGSFQDDLEHGQIVYYHPNGKVQSRANYVAGKANGTFTTYHDNGRVKIEGKFEADQRAGTWKTYHINGNISSVNSYKNGELDGRETEYYVNGTVANITNYALGKADGIQQSFDDDGKLFSEVVFENGKLRDIKFFDKQGKVISNATSRNGSAWLSFFDPHGNRTKYGYYNKEGMLTGKGYFFYASGDTSMVGEYRDGLLNGNRVTYYENRVKSAEGPFVNEEENGYHMWYHPSGKLSRTGPMQEGVNVGEHKWYDPLGKLSSSVHYENGDESRFMAFYQPNGRLSTEQFYHTGWLQYIINYDTTGLKTDTVRLINGSGPYVSKFQNGKSFVVANYKGGYLDGAHRTYYPDGSLNALQFYRGGSRDSAYKVYHVNGKLATEGWFNMGDRAGIWKFYHDNGKVQTISYYKDGMEDSIGFQYNEDGSIDKVFTYAFGELHGPTRIFGNDEQLAVQLNYHRGRLVSYTYTGKDGKLVSPIPVKNGEGKVTAFYANGTKSFESTFKLSQIDGARRVYFTDGKPYIESFRVMGKEHGKKKVYHKNGQLMQSTEYFYDNIHGTATGFYPDGKLQSQEFYYNGDLHGQCRYFDANGKLQLRTYFYGILQSIQ